MAEYMIGDADNMEKLPDEISFVQSAPLMCAGVCHPSCIPPSHLLIAYR